MASFGVTSVFYWLFISLALTPFTSPRLIIRVVTRPPSRPTITRSSDPQVQPMAPEPQPHLHPNAAGNRSAGPSLLQRILGLALAGIAGFFTLGLLLIFAVLAFITGHPLIGSLLLGLLLLAGVGVAFFGLRTAQRGLTRGSRDSGEVPQANAAREQVQDESARRELLRLWEKYNHRIPAEARPALRAAIASADEALVAFANEPLSRERYEVQQAATHDLPDLLDVYARSGSDPAALAEALGLIDRRLRQLVQQAEAERQREFAARREYISGKYASDPLDDK